ncbi:MAG TPA: D-arabinono-1,4-lactone oxidase, partial [Polyangiaceae bacterium]
RVLNGATPAELALIHDVFMAVLVDPNYSDKSYLVFNLGDINLFRVYGIELAFALSDTLAATRELFVIAAEQARLGRNHSVPVTLRFVRQADSLLAMQYGRDTTMMEIGMLVAAPGSQALLETYERRFIDKFRARPHWGLDLSILKDFKQVRELFPRADDWYRVYSELNRSGVFNGRITDRLGISIGPAASEN